MSDCPYCGAEFIDGVDVCEACGQSLTHLHLPPPGTALEEAILTDRIRKLDPREPIAVAPSTRVGDVLPIMVENHIGCLLVVEDDKLLGVFSERDALMRLNVDAAQHADAPISDFMTPHPETLEAKTRIAFAIQRMDLGGYRHVPIVDGEGKAVGIISARDILDYLTDKIAASAD